MSEFLGVSLILIGIGDIIWLGCCFVKAGKSMFYNFNGVIEVLGIIFLIITSFTFGIMSIAMPRNFEQSWNETYHVGEHKCIECGSCNTEGYHAFFTNDGLVAKNEKYADYTIIHCNDCGYNWHYELNSN